MIIEDLEYENPLNTESLSKVRGGTRSDLLIFVTPRINTDASTQSENILASDFLGAGPRDRANNAVTNDAPVTGANFLQVVG